MAAVAFNTHEFIKSLEQVGISEEQAEAISAGILRAQEVSNLATKSDLRLEIREAQNQTDAKLDALSAKLDILVGTVNEIKGRFDNTESDLKSLTKDVLEIKGRVSAMPSTWQLIMMVVGIMAFTTALSFTLIKFWNSTLNSIILQPFIPRSGGVFYCLNFEN